MTSRLKALVQFSRAGRWCRQQPHRIYWPLFQAQLPLFYKPTWHYRAAWFPVQVLPGQPDCCGAAAASSEGAIALL